MTTAPSTGPAAAACALPYRDWSSARSTREDDDAAQLSGQSGTPQPYEELGRTSVQDVHRPRRSLPGGPASLLRRVLVTVVGTALLLVGAALLVLPGPGLLVLLGGLAVLGREFPWADRLARRLRRRARAAADGLRGRRPAGTPVP